MIKYISGSCGYAAGAVAVRGYRVSTSRAFRASKCLMDPQAALKEAGAAMIANEIEGSHGTHVAGLAAAN